MGKLRKLRKAIESNPKRWRYTGNSWNYCLHVAIPYSVHGAVFLGGEWVPDWRNPSYKAFVAHVLREVGSADVRTVREGDVTASNP